MHSNIVRTGILAGALLLAGCNTLPSASPASQPWGGLATHAVPLSAQLSALFAESSDYAVLTPEESPWGAGVELHLSPVYFAANGRLCREFEVFTPMQPDRPQAEIGCEAQAGQWLSTRNVTRELTTRKQR